MSTQISRPAREPAATRPRTDPWNDDDALGEPAHTPLTRAQARALVAKDPPLSPWRVVAVQALLGVLVAALAGGWTQSKEIAWSALYGAATVVLPAALMARGMTSKLSSLTPAGSAVSVMVWEFMKLAASIAMLMLAPKLVQGLSWPALLVTLVLCIKVYWFALLWRGRRNND